MQLDSAADVTNEDPAVSVLPVILSHKACAVRTHGSWEGGEGSFIHFISQNTSYIKTMKNKHTKSVP